MAKFIKGNPYAGMGGRARAAKLTLERRREIAQAGLQGLADKHFEGDVARAVAWLSSEGGRTPKRLKAEAVEGHGIVKIDLDGRCLCPFHGVVEGAEYEAQNPAPCGCVWFYGPGSVVWACQNDPVDFGDAGQ